jgi:endoglucanase
VILDPHNYARYYPDPNNSQSSTQGLIGSASVPDSAFADLWSRLAADYSGNSHVIFGLMNEPNTMPTEQWVGAANAAIAAIRSAGASNLMLVPGNGWTGAWTWSDNSYGTPNATAMLSIVDPGHNFAFEVHQYLDANGSGSSSQIYNNDPMIGAERLTDFTQWLEAHNLKGFLGEFAVANSTIGTGASQIGAQTIDNMINYMQANSSAWLGYTWWSAGPWWGNYQFTLEPTNLGAPNQADQPAMGVLQPYLAGLHVTGDVNADKVVNGLDISMIASNWLKTGAGTAGDANSDGIVNGLDIALVASNWLSTSAGSAAPVPEPTTLALASLGGLALGCGMCARRFGK